MNTIVNGCMGETIEFGGVVWRRNERPGVIAEYLAWLPGVGTCRISQYPDETAYGDARKWFATNKLEALIADCNLQYIEISPSTIADSMQEAMEFCLQARVPAVQELKRVLLAIGVGDPYGVGFRDGQQAIKDKIREVLS